MMKQAPTPAPLPPPVRSKFVTVVGYVFVAIAGAILVISILQNIMLALMFSGDEAQTHAVSPVGRFISENLDLLFFLPIPVSGVTLISAVGLLKRRNWGRILFVTLLFLGIAWCVLATVGGPFLLLSVAGEEINRQNLLTVMLFGGVPALLMTLVVSILFVWMIKRLLSGKIRAEFDPQIRTTP